MIASRLPASPHFAGIAFAVVMHLAAVWALLQYEPMRQQLVAIAPIMVSLVTSPQIAPPQELPKPKPVVKKQPLKKIAPVPPQPVLAIAEPAPVPATTWVPPAPPKPEPAPTPLAPPMPITLPSFNADYLNNPAPPYPALSRRLGEEGKVVLRVFVDENGLPAQVQIRTSSGYNRLDSTALETVRQWKFTPARRGEQSIGAWVLVPVSFNLRS